MRRPIAVPLIAAVILFGGCNPAPKYVQPPAPTPLTYKEVVPEQFKEGAGWRVAQPGDDKIRTKWWEIYNDPQLSALEEQATVANQTVAAAEANFRAGRALVVTARATLYPTISTTPTYSNSRISAT